MDRWLFGYLCQAEGDNELNRAVWVEELQVGSYLWVVVRSDGELGLLAHVEGSSCDDNGVRRPSMSR